MQVINSYITLVDNKLGVGRQHDQRYLIFSGHNSLRATTGIIVGNNIT